MKCEKCGASEDANRRIITYSYIRTDKLLHHTVTEACRRCGETKTTCKGEGLIGTCNDCRYKDTTNKNTIMGGKG